MVTILKVVGSSLIDIHDICLSIFKVVDYNHGVSNK